MTLPVHALRRPRLLLIGCGDIGLRVLRLLHPRWRVFALTSTAARVPALRAAGAMPLLGDLDDAATLARLGALADAVLHLAPPQAEGGSDRRTRNLLRALARGARVQRLVYASTSGVYGDCGGARVPETRGVAPASARALRRADAEAVVRWYGRRSGASVSILRVPGIYALDRKGGSPRERLLRGTPLLRAEDDVYTSHIHADDLARACVAALHRGGAQRAFNVCDDTELRMGDYFDLAADLLGCARAPRLAPGQARQQLTPLQQSFMSESRRLVNTRLRRELRLRLRYPTVAAGLCAAPARED
ncbi:MAG: NAD(P)-dependent oxidoreductase [Rubrivivax sp. SCN 71-131]|nr:MAG: NAD(P)-dependent oxidoreductase [Rubrivivax sp. SCN 71-131]